MLDVETLKEIKIDLSNCKLKELREEQLSKLKAGTLEERLIPGFLAWVERAIDEGEIEIIGPSLYRRAKNLLRENSRDKKQGRPRVIKEEADRRIELCRSCELYNRPKGTCKHPDCGCVMRRKVRWAGSECPIGRWGATTNPELIEGGKK